MVKIANKDKIRVVIYECLMWFTFSKKLYVLVYKKQFMPQLHLFYALLFYISSYFIEEIVMPQRCCVFGYANLYHSIISNNMLVSAE